MSENLIRLNIYLKYNAINISWKHFQDIFTWIPQTGYSVIFYKLSHILPISSIFFLVCAGMGYGVIKLQNSRRRKIKLRQEMIIGKHCEKLGKHIFFIVSWLYAKVMLFLLRGSHLIYLSTSPVTCKIFI